MLIYGTILTAVTVALITSLAVRTPFKVDVIRDRATLARVVADGRIENIYRLQVMNATEREQHFRIRADGLPGLSLRGQDHVDIPPEQMASVPVQLQLAPDATDPGSHAIRFHIRSEDLGEVAEKSVFIVPHRP